MKRYKCPSLSTLVESFPGVELSELRKIRSVLLHWKTPRELSQNTRVWMTRCFNEPSWHDQALEAFNEFLGGHGVEALRLSSLGEDGDPDEFSDNGVRHCPAFSYVNMGDTYVTTILRDHEHGAWVIGSYGDVVEWWEAKHAKRKRTS